MGFISLDELEAEINNQTPPGQLSAYDMRDIKPPAWGSRVTGEDMPWYKAAGLGFGAGMENILHGGKQLFAEGLNKVSDGNLVSDETVKRLRQEEADRRLSIEALKHEGGRTGGGIDNPVSWGEFGGEMAATLYLPGKGAAQSTAAVAKNLRPVVRGALSGMAGGAAGGAAYGTLAPVTERDSRSRNVVEGALTGGLTGGVLGSVAGPVINKLGALSDDLPVALEPYLRQLAPYIPSYVKNYSKSQLEAFHGRRADGISALYKLRNMVTDKAPDGTEIPVELPKNQFDMLAYVEKAKDRLFQEYNKISTAADESGMGISADSVRGYLRSILDDPAATAKARGAAKSILKDFELDSFSPLDAQKRLAEYNKELADFYTGKGTGGSSVGMQIKKKVLDIFRADVNKSIDALDNRYSEFKRAWGGINELESGMLTSYEKRLSKEAKLNPATMLAGEQILYAAAKGNPNYLIPAIGTVAMNKAHKFFYGEDRAVRGMFNTVRSRLGDQEFKPVDLVEHALYPKQPKVLDPSTGRMVPASQELNQRAPINSVDADQPFAFDPYIGAKGPYPEQLFTNDPSTGRMVPTSQELTPRAPITSTDPNQLFTQYQVLDPSTGKYVSTFDPNDPLGLLK